MRSFLIAAAIWGLVNGQDSNGTDSENEPLPPNGLALTPPMGCEYFLSIHPRHRLDSMAVLCKECRPLMAYSIRESLKAVC